MKSKPRILFLVPEDYAALDAKGIAHMILERDEQGFFEKVITVHPLANKKMILELNDRHMLYEFNLRQFFYPNKMGILMPLLPIKFLSMIRQLTKLIRKEKIDMIRATDPYFMGLIGLTLSRLTRIPFCISIHSDYKLVFALTPQTGFKNFLRIGAKWMPDFVSPKAQLVMPISIYLKQAVSSRVNDERIKIIHHGIDFDFQPDFDLRDKFNLPTNKKIISFVGRLSKDNYMDDILQVVERLSLIRDDFILVMVGGGELESYIKDWISQRPQLASSIRLLGFQPNHIGRSLRYISIMSLCLMSGFSLIEAAAAASPMISYDIEWHGELVSTQETGFLIKEKDVNGVYEAICFLLNNPDIAAEMGQRARKKAYQYHDIKKTSQLKRCYYQELYNKKIHTSQAI